MGYFRAQAATKRWLARTLQLAAAALCGGLQTDREKEREREREKERERERERESERDRERAVIFECSQSVAVFGSICVF